MNYQICSVLLKINVGFSHDQIYIYNKQFTNMFKIHRLQIYKKKTLKKQPNKQYKRTKHPPSLHSGPIYPAAHPVRQVPLTVEHCIGSLQ